MHIKQKGHVQDAWFLTFMTVSNMGMRTNLMNPIWAVGFVTLSRSMKGATGRPSDFSLSLCPKHTNRDIFVLSKLPPEWITAAWFWYRVTALAEVTCMKYSSSRQSTQGSATSVGLTSLEISQHLIKTIFSCTQKRKHMMLTRKWVHYIISRHTVLHYLLCEMVGCSKRGQIFTCIVQATAGFRLKTNCGFCKICA